MDLPEDIAPLVRHDFTSRSGIRFTSACFPGADWSLGPLQKPEDAASQETLVRKLRGALRHLGASRAFAPSPVQFNGRIIMPDCLTVGIPLGDGLLLQRNRAAPADGTLLHSAGDAGLYSAGGCGFIAAALDGHLVFAHAGRDCIIDRKRVLTGAPSRQMESVVDYILNALTLAVGPGRSAEIEVWVLYSISAEDFFHSYRHEEYGEYNRLVGPDLHDRGLGAGALKKQGGICIDIPEVIRAQFIQRGVRPEQISLEHAPLPRELPTTRNGGGRYLVALARHS